MDCLSFFLRWGWCLVFFKYLLVTMGDSFIFISVSLEGTHRKLSTFSTHLGFILISTS